MGDPAAGSGALDAHGLGVASVGGWAGRCQKHLTVSQCPNPLDSSNTWASHCSGFSCCRVGAIGCAGSVSSCDLWVPERVGSELWCPGLAAPWHGTFPDQGSNPGPLRWQADSLPLDHQGRPNMHLSSQLWWVRNLDGALLGPFFQFLTGCNQDVGQGWGLI